MSSAPGIATAAPAPPTANVCATHGTESQGMASGAAEAAARAAGAPNGCAAHGSGSEGTAASVAGASNVCASNDPWLASLLEGIDETDPFELDARLLRALGAEQQRNAQMGPWLLAVA